MEPIKGVSIGDKFKDGRQVYEVVDIYEVKSLTTGFTVNHLCIVKALNTLSTNSFEVPFATVVRKRITE